MSLCLMTEVSNDCFLYLPRESQTFLREVRAGSPCAQGPSGAAVSRPSTLPTASAQVVPILQRLDEEWPRSVAVIRGPHSAPQVGRLSMVLVSAQMQRAFAKGSGRMTNTHPELWGQEPPVPAPAWPALALLPEFGTSLSMSGTRVSATCPRLPQAGLSQCVGAGRVRGTCRETGSLRVFSQEPPPKHTGPSVCLSVHSSIRPRCPSSTLHPMKTIQDLAGHDSSAWLRCSGCS